MEIKLTSMDVFRYCGTSLRFMSWQRILSSLFTLWYLQRRSSEPMAAHAHTPSRSLRAANRHSKPRKFITARRNALTTHWMILVKVIPMICGAMLLLPDKKLLNDNLKYQQLNSIHCIRMGKEQCRREKGTEDRNNKIRADNVERNNDTTDSNFTDTSVQMSPVKLWLWRRSGKVRLIWKESRP